MTDTPHPPLPAGSARSCPTGAEVMPTAVTGGVALSVWPCAQRSAHTQRLGRYLLPQTTGHPARMLPDVAAYAIAALTEPGHLVFDPLCGTGTTLVEALEQGRAAVGIDIDPRWASLARRNLTVARYRHGGHGNVLSVDSRRLPDTLPPDYLDQMLGRVNLVFTAWPHPRTPHPPPDPDPANLAHGGEGERLAGMTTLLRGVVPLLAPGAHVVLTARPWREPGGVLLDLLGAVTQAGLDAGLVPVQHCVALLAGIREHHLIPRATRYQRIAVAQARHRGAAWHLACTEDIVVFRSAHRPSRRLPRHVAARARLPRRARTQIVAELGPVLP